MATAVQKSSEAPSAPNPQSRLLISSAIGALYGAVAILFVLFGVPYLWKLGLSDWMTQHLGSFFDIFGMIVVLVTVAAGLVLGGLAIAGPNPPEGLRAGVFTILASLLLIFLVTIGLGDLIERYALPAAANQQLGLIITIAIAGGLLAAAVYFALKPQFASFLVAFEGQGWFRIKTHKPSQGLLVRRLTMVGIIVLIGTGVWTLTRPERHMLDTPSGHWRVHIPFTAKTFIPVPPDNLRLAPDMASARYINLLPDVAYTLPMILAALGLWVSWRSVNYPMFADFLIATSAEMNKVSWTSRKRLVADTIVVLVTVILFTVFLLVVDQLWGFILTRETLGGIVPKAKNVNKAATEEVQERPY
jgi:preprotein translocase SecE subunit